MMRFVAIFFLVTMILNVALPAVEQLQKGARYELVELEVDDVDDESNENNCEKENESESQQEKEYTQNYLPFSTHNLLCSYSLALFSHNESLFSQRDLPISGLYTFLPELPPEL